tara:strand:- start:632 stop:793 length:162 start_codon:yes stop_codon:yes gene_type:complete
MMIELFIFIAGLLLGMGISYGKCVEEMLTWDKYDFLAWKEETLTSIKEFKNGR